MPEWIGIVGPSIQTATFIGVLLAVWNNYRSSREADSARAKDHEKRIAAVESGCATKEEVKDLARLIAELDESITEHHMNSDIHRTKDSERRLQDLMEAVHQLAESNKSEHADISKQIAAIRQR
jgi:uncharacterized protein YfcZ (UPF0381/DUF406 family)